MTDRLTLTRPDDWHIHLRDGDLLKDTVADASRYFGRAIVMPNLVPPVRNGDQADAYRERILAARPAGSGFEPLMVLYLTDQTSPELIRSAAAKGQAVAAKLYPAGATTNSDSGVTRLENIFPALEAMAEVGMLLLVHGEVTHSDVDIFDREKAFIDQQLVRVVERFPTLKVVFEHITTGDAVAFVNQASERVAATITAHHLLYNRNHMLAGGIRPHYYCLPILKRQTHQQALKRRHRFGLQQVLSGYRFGSAPAPRQGGCLRLCRLLHRLCGHRAVRRSLRSSRRAGQAGGICQFSRCRLLRSSAAYRPDNSGAGKLDGAGSTAARWSGRNAPSGR